MKKFFSEFKTFITRGNVMDMAVGVIVGGAFTSIVNALSNNVLKPIINWLLALIFGANSLGELYTMLKPAYDAEGVIDLAQSIYIDWGTFINAIINFLLIALVLFTIVKTLNSLKDGNKKLLEGIAADIPTKEDRKAMKAQGIRLSDKAAVHAYLEAKRSAEAAEKQAAEQAAEEEARRQREQNPTAEDLLKAILQEMKNK